MATTVQMPQLGETVTEGTILSWSKGVGDSVSVDEVLVEISTDKVDTEVPSPVAGVLLEIIARAGETIEVGAPMCVIGDEGDAPAVAPAPEPAAQEEPAAAPEPEPAPAPAEQVPPAGETEPAAAPREGGTSSQSFNLVVEPAEEDPSKFVSPIVRRLAREHDLDLADVTGTGEGGRVTRKDLEAHLAAAPAAAPAPAPAPEPSPAPASPAPAPAAPPAPTPTPAAEKPAPSAVPEIPSVEGDTVHELSRLRTMIATNMRQAKDTAAHVFTSIEVDFERVERVRSSHKAQFMAENGFSLTYLPFIVRATLDALRAYPQVNSSFFLDERRHVLHGDLNIGIAVDLDQEGLIVPVLKGADQYRLAGLARNIVDLANRARDKALGPDDLSGGTITITNMGPFGTMMTAPIINVPQTAILATDGIKKRPVVVEGESGDQIAIHHVGYLGLTWDHRAFDGSTAGMFLARVKQNIETWDWEQELV